MRVLHDNRELVSVYGNVLVPTMGALHEGHFTLVREAVRRRDAHAHGRPVVVSVFVNPSQFNDPKDLERYPRTLEADVRGCQLAGADVVYAPGVESVYPPGESVDTPRLPEVATMPGLEDAHRPGHFAGVCRVVKRLFDLLRPSAALFGEKDWQQLAVISAMTRELSLPVEVLPIKTIREPDGLAMSSRNVFIRPEDRAKASAISRALREASAILDPAAAERHMHEVLTSAGLIVEYAVVRDAAALTRMVSGRHASARSLIAARLGPVRLIDNAEWPMNDKM